MFLQFDVIPQDGPSLRFCGGMIQQQTSLCTETYATVWVQRIHRLVPTMRFNVEHVITAKSFQKLREVSKAIFTWTITFESSATVDEATKKARDLLKRLSKGGFTLIKFVSHIPNLPNSLDANREHLTVEDENSRVLGLKWNHRIDTLVVSRRTSPDLNRPGTQRVVLSLVSVVYLPGFC